MRRRSGTALGSTLTLRSDNDGTEVVTDPTFDSELGDFVWHQDVAKLEQQMRGGEPGWWKRRRGKVWTTQGDAISDGQNRMSVLCERKDRPNGAYDRFANMFSPANIRRTFG